jgi:hypothetical protein
MIKIKGWHKFQHFKDRRPPWIKLYRDILDDLEWHELDSDTAKMLISFWLIASENDGNLPDTKVLSFRLRVPKQVIDRHISKLSHWLEQSDIGMISERYQNDTPETETETETETDIDRESMSFNSFWKSYPRKCAKPAAVRAWKKIKTTEIEAIMRAVVSQSINGILHNANPKYIPHPATWLNQRRWEDGVQEDDYSHIPDENS